MLKPHFFCVFLFGVILCHVNVSGKQLEDQHKNESKEDAIEEGFGLEYSRYLKEVSEVLNADEEFQKSIASGTEGHLDVISLQTRTKLDELKRMEVRRLKDLHKKSMRLASAQQKKDVQFGKIPSKKDLPKVDDAHVDTKRPSEFGMEDLKKLIFETAKKIGDIDALRRREFKQHELKKAYNYKTKFRDLPVEEQQKKLKEQLEKAKKHAKINHPGNREQLKELWEKRDHMDPRNYNPKTLFMMHDIDGDGLLSPSEVEALFEVELNKLYQMGLPGVDMVERDEEMNRMREHVFTEVDLDRDGMVSWEEFSKSSQSDGDEGWETVNDEQQFTDEELRRYEEELKAGES